MTPRWLSLLLHALDTVYASLEDADRLDLAQALHSLLECSVCISDELDSRQIASVMEPPMG